MSDELKYHDLGDDTLEALAEATKNMPLGTQFKFIGDNKQKGLIRVAKIADIYAHLLAKNILVTINEVYFDAFDEEARNILFRQELDRVQVNMKNGKVKIAAHELSTSVGALQKFGIDAVARANQLHALYEAQQTDAKTDEYGLTDAKIAEAAVAWLS